MSVSYFSCVSDLVKKSRRAIDTAKYWLDKAHDDDKGTVNTVAERAAEVLDGIDRHILDPIATIEESIKAAIEEDGVVVSAKEHTVGRDGTGVCRSTRDCYEIDQDTVTVDDIDDGPLPVDGRLKVWIGTYQECETVSYRLVSFFGGNAVYSFEIL